jgi:hypothetical protein
MTQACECVHDFVLDLFLVEVRVSGALSVAGWTSSGSSQRS